MDHSSHLKAYIGEYIRELGIGKGCCGFYIESNKRNFDFINTKRISENI